MRHWFVISPVWEETEPVLWDGSGPTVELCDAVSVAAETRREAIIAGVKLMPDWPTVARRDLFTNPFVGVRAVDARCEHGFCWCDLDHPGQGDECGECDGPLTEDER